MSKSSDENCAFCKIIKGESDGAVVYENDAVLAFLDQRPLFPGHCLLVPKAHVTTLADLPDDLIGPLFKAAQLLAQAVEQGLWAEGSFVAMNNRVSQSVPHLHVHIVPRRKKDGLKGFFWPRNAYRDAAHQQSVLETLHKTVREIVAAQKA